jgi:hypothetical protein
MNLDPCRRGRITASFSIHCGCLEAGELDRFIILRSRPLIMTGLLVNDGCLQCDRFNLLDVFGGECELFGLEVLFPPVSLHNHA